jgi:glutamyl-tRNA synthetase
LQRARPCPPEASLSFLPRSSLLYARHDHRNPLRAQPYGHAPHWQYPHRAAQLDAGATCGGKFLLRIDDTDGARSREEYVEGIRADLAWLGLNYEGEERQSARFALYEREFAKLVESGRVYRCYETAQELDLKRKVLLSRGLPPIYDRGALALTEADHEAKAAAGEAPHWRFLLDRDEAITWEDGVRGPQNFDPATMSDPVIRRADGSWLYMLPSVIDDIDMGVTQILRGEDHVSNTATQVQMFTALGAPVPALRIARC